MKRFYVTAAIAASLLATGCQKTYVVDEVNTPIGFEANLGKQTKAIMDDATYKTDHTFGVFAYALTENKTWESNPATDNVVMDNVEIKYQTDVWRANNGTKYYWPNDDETSISFFAYSPYSNGADGALGQTPTFDKIDGIKLTGYEHNDARCKNDVDFMIATPQKDQKFKSNIENNGVVKTQFAHQMTQVNFTIKKDAKIANDVNLYLTSVQLIDIQNKADFKSLPTPDWTLKEETHDYTIDFPTLIAGSEVGYTTDKVLTTTAENSTPVTMLPQTLTGPSSTKVIKVIYRIKGTGVATETVERDIKFDVNWTENMKITYNLTINMNEITFAPTVDAWTPDEKQVSAN